MDNHYAPAHTMNILKHITPVRDTNRAEEIARKLEGLIAKCELEAGASFRNQGGSASPVPSLTWYDE